MKRETAVVSYSIFEAQHSSGRVILLGGLQSYDTHLSVTFIKFISDMQLTNIIFFRLVLGIHLIPTAD